MAGNYPPGTGPGDPNAPWNESEPPECEECGGYYSEDGHNSIVVVVDGEEKEKPCPHIGQNEQDYVEQQEADHAEMKMDQRRLEERSEK